MKLIKENKQKRRQVWEFDDYFRKKWLFNDERWLIEHYEILQNIAPDGYLKGWGTNDDTMWIDTNKIEGELASTFEHTPDFVKRIENFCLNHYFTKTQQEVTEERCMYVTKNLMGTKMNIRKIQPEARGVQCFCIVK